MRCGRISPLYLELQCAAYTRLNYIPFYWIFLSYFLKFHSISFLSLYFHLSFTSQYTVSLQRGWCCITCFIGGVKRWKRAEVKVSCLPACQVPFFFLGRDALPPIIFQITGSFPRLFLFTFSFSLQLSIRKYFFPLQLFVSHLELFQSSIRRLVHFIVPFYSPCFFFLCCRDRCIIAL